MRILIFALAWLLAAQAWPKLQLVATTPDLGALAALLAGEEAQVLVLCPAGSDPHTLEARPSQMVQLRGADLLISNGAELEQGWLPLLIRGARRPGLAHFDASEHVELIERPAPGRTRDMGDVHALGNPHFMLDPLRAAQVGEALAEALAGLDPGKGPRFRAAAQDFHREMQRRVEGWKARVAATGVRKVLAYHSDLNYLFSRLGLEPGLYFEPKPGLPPTARHLALLLEQCRAQGIRLALISHLHPVAPAQKLASRLPELRYARVAGQVGAMKGAGTLAGLYEQVVAAIEGKP